MASLRHTSVALVTLALIAAACSSEDGAIPSTAATTGVTAGTTTSTVDPDGQPVIRPNRVPDELASFPLSTIIIGSEQWEVAVANTPALRSQGLMRVTDLLDLEGMLFQFDETREYGFFMKDTLIDLDIAYFDENGTYLTKLTMTPCVTQECETYLPGVEFRYALEAPAGDLAFLTDGMDLVMLSRPP